MIDTIYANMIDSPDIDLGADTYFEYTGSISVASNMFSFPGVPLTRTYTTLKIGNYTYKVINQSPSGVVVDRSPGKPRTFVGRIVLGYAADDGRNPANWSTPGLKIRSISPGRMEFEENFRVMRKYSATLLRDVESSTGTLPAGTKIEWRTGIVADPIVLESTDVSDGIITLRFDKGIGEYGIIDGIPVDRYEVDDDTIYIYTPYVGDAQIELSGFSDIYGNPMDDLSIDVVINAENQIFEYNDSQYRMRSRSRYDFEDYISTEAQRCLQQKLNLD